PTALLDIYPLSLHDALPILQLSAMVDVVRPHRADDRQVVDAAAHMRPPIADFNAALSAPAVADLQWIKFRQNLSHVRRRGADIRSEEHTSELQSPDHLVCRL